MEMPQTIEIPKWFDLHTHFRQGANVASYIQDHLAMGCAGALAMPNTLPPVSRVDGANTSESWSIKSYEQVLRDAGAEQFQELIVPLYLTKDTTPEMIDRGVRKGLLRACKYYPPHGTTNSAHGIPIERWIGSDVLRSIENHGIMLCLHGEQHGLTGADYFDAEQTAESRFYREWMPKLLETHPNLRVVCEHITTREAVEFVRAAPGGRVGATITPQHLLYTVGHLVQGFKYHLYCLPLVKFSQDRSALREAVTQPGQNRFFAGTDSAPHTQKATDCGCAAGCYTGGCAPQLYAMAFEEAGADLQSGEGLEAFLKFLSKNGPAHYGFPVSRETFRLVKEPSTIKKLEAPEGSITPLPVGMDLSLKWSLG